MDQGLNVLKLGEAVDFEILDDSGLLSLVDVSAYSTFVAEDWEYEEILLHFNEQMAKRHILVWNCGDGGDNYRIRVINGFSDVVGWRETVGSIFINSGQLNICSYAALTMAAQFEDHKLPGMGETEYELSVEDGLHKVRIVQNYNPETIDYDNLFPVSDR